MPRARHARNAHDSGHVQEGGEFDRSDAWTGASNRAAAQRRWRATWHGSKRAGPESFAHWTDASRKASCPSRGPSGPAARSATSSSRSGTGASPPPICRTCRDRSPRPAPERERQALRLARDQHRPRADPRSRDCTRCERGRASRARPEDAVDALRPVRTLAVLGIRADLGQPHAELTARRWTRRAACGSARASLRRRTRISASRKLILRRRPFRSKARRGAISRCTSRRRANGS